MRGFLYGLAICVLLAACMEAANAQTTEYTNEDLLNAIRNTDLKDADALRVRLAEVESRKARLVAADKLIAESIARLDNKKGEQ